MLSALLVPSLIILLLIFINAFFVAAEFALNNLRATDIKDMEKSDDLKSQQILQIFQTDSAKEQYIATTQIGVTIASLGLGMYGQPYIATFLAPYLTYILGEDTQAFWFTLISYTISLSLLTYLHTVLGHMVPRSVAIFSAKQVLVLVLPFVNRLQRFFGQPISWILSTSQTILDVCGLKPEKQSLQSSEELELIVTESAEGGLLAEEERTIIHKILTFNERQVNQVMTPRPKVQAISYDAPLNELIECVADSPYSRHPVYQEDLDHIIGILHVKDLVRQQLLAKGSFDLRLLLRPAPTVPEHYPVAQLLTAFKRERIHLAIVLDEFGGTAGIVTLEDLVEEVVGEVRDEFDAELDPIIELEPGVLEVVGRYLIDDLADYVDLGEETDLPDVETVGGLITAILGRPPQLDDKVIYHETIRLHVLAVDGLAVARARINFSAPILDNNASDFLKGEEKISKFPPLGS